MFNKTKVEDDKDIMIKQLNNRILELEMQLNQVANDNGSVVVKQLPNGVVELNGIEIDNTTEVEYYNSSQATYGELTMFRIGKETKQREMNKLIEAHMDECDRYKNMIDRLHEDINDYINKSKLDEDTINMYIESENKLKTEIKYLQQDIDVNFQLYASEKETIISRYEGMIAGLEEDIASWKERYLKINNILLDGTIITKYGKILGN